MKQLSAIYLLIFTLTNLPVILFAQESTHHNIKILLSPDEHLIEVENTITLSKILRSTDEGNVHFTLNNGLQPVSATKGVKIIRIKDTAQHDTGIPPTPLYKGGKGDLVKFDHYRVVLPEGNRTFTIKYKGEIYNPLKQQNEERDRGFRETPGIISADGIYLTASTYWYPQFNNDGLVTFSMKVRLPQGWSVISQGRRASFKQKGERPYQGWDSSQPQDEIYLIGGKFTEYSKQAGSALMLVFLRNPDEKLADKYMETGARYLKMYSKLIGPYPYKKFALVENFWETGYGMPSFTLLGPKIIRFPFILHSSYPHEILHNWWGNGVFVDFDAGNWSEGLTAYLSDHLAKEQRNQGAEYRRTTLQKYTDYVAKSKDFPITEFRSRHSSASEAVGYGKTLMFFHMLRLQLGDEVFTRGLQKFYQENKFKLATFRNLREAFESASGKDLQTEFNQWIKRTGAPQLRVSNAAVRTDGDGKGYRLTAVLKQIQQEEAYTLRIPLAVHLKDHEKAYQTSVLMDKKVLKLSLRLPAFPLRLDVDPEFDLFRRLDRNEIPPSLSQAFGADKSLVILPAAANQDVLQGYRKLAEFWRQSPSRQIEIKLDKDINKLPADRSVWLLGWENRFKQKINAGINIYDVSINNAGVNIEQTKITRKNHSIVLTTRHPDNPDSALVWIAAENIEAIPGLGRKLPHYGKYSYLSFEGNEPSIILKGQWPTLNSPMSVTIRQADMLHVPRLEHGNVNKFPLYKGGKGDLAPRRALADLPTIFSDAMH